MQFPNTSQATQALLQLGMELNLLRPRYLNIQHLNKDTEDLLSQHAFQGENLTDDNVLAEFYILVHQVIEMWFPAVSTVNNGESLFEDLDLRIETILRNHYGLPAGGFMPDEGSAEGSEME